jgi:hypothetical protein
MNCLDRALWNERERDVLLDFVMASGRIEMEVLLDNGPYRHLRFAQRDTIYYGFDLITAPELLVYVAADKQDVLTFRTAYEALSLFRRAAHPVTGQHVYQINPEYYAQRLPRAGREVESFSHQAAREAIEEIVADYAERFAQDGENATGPHPDGLRIDIEHAGPDLLDEEGVRELLSAWEVLGVCSDTFELDFDVWDPWYLTALHQITHGAHMYYRDSIDYGDWGLVRGIARRVGENRRRAGRILAEPVPPLAPARPTPQIITVDAL